MLDLYQRIYQLLFAVWRRRYLIMASVMVTPIIALIVAFTIPKSYKTSTTMLVHEPEILNPYLKDRAASIQVGQRIEGLKVLVHSYQLLAQIAKRLNLVTPEMPLAEKRAVYASLASRLELEARGGGLIQLNYYSPTRAEAADTLRKISQVFVKNLLLPQPSESRGSEQFLKEQLTKRKNQLIDAEQRLSEFKTTNADSLPAFHGANVARVRQMEEQLAAKEKELVGVERDLAKYQEQLVPLSQPLADLEEEIVKGQFNLALLHNDKSAKKNVISAKLVKLNRLLAKRDRMLKEVAQVNLNELQGLRGNVVVARRPIQPQPLPQSLLFNQLYLIQVADNKVSQLTREISNLNERLKTLQPGIHAFGKMERELNGLQQDVDDKRSSYQQILRRYQMTQEMHDLGRYTANERVQIIDVPGQPIKATGRSKQLFLMTGLFAGIAFGIGLALLLELLDSSIRYRFQLEKNLGISVFARLPKLKQADSLSA